MTTQELSEDGVAGLRSTPPWAWAEILWITVSLLVMYAPTYRVLDQQVWSYVGQGHGPVMLALALWLAWERKDRLAALQTQPALVPATVCLVLGFLLYVAGRSQDILLLDAGSQIPVLAGLLLAYRGWAGLKTMWFPLFFFIFLLPLPGPLVDAITGPLKAGVSHVAEWVMYGLGFPIGRAGVTLTIGPYKLLVADACAGLNSLFALEAVGVFYISLVKHEQRWRNVALAALVVPIAFASNVIRVVTLVLVTYYFGDEAGQGFVHGFAGVLLFIAATLLLILTDSLLGLFVPGASARAGSNTNSHP
ncbi:MAG: exosortase [Pseudomonadota bacterium]|jgi:exosortase B